MKALGKYLEATVFLLILYSVITHFIELETGSPEPNSDFFFWSEIAVTGCFTVEYLVRWIASRSWFYPLRVMAIVDLLAILPFYLSFLVDLRSLRLVRALRMVRLLKLYRYTDALRSIRRAFHRIRYEFAVIAFALLTLGWIGSVMIFELERDRQPETFGQLSDAVWYTIVTITTVGYGDKVPLTPGGKIVAFGLMLSGLGLFATFVSLVGSAFLEELRRKSQRETADRKRDGAIVMYPMFSPDQVLADLRTGSLGGSPDGEETETARLLVIACEILIEERRAARASDPALRRAG